MGKMAKTSRKGKKAWRANISTEDIGDFFEKSTKDAHSGGSLTSVPSESLFFVDKSRDLSVKRKIEKHREKVLRCDSILQKNQFVEPVPSSIHKKSKKRKEVSKAKEAAEDGQKGDHVESSGVADIWDDKVAVENNIKAKKMPKPSIIPAVEVEPSGCSFNPSFDSHQDSLARAVADEMQKVYRNELGPLPVPVTVPGNVIDEEDMLFLDAENESDDANVEDLDENGDPTVEKRSSKKKRITTVEHNKRARRKEVLKKEAKAKKVEDLSKEIDSVQDIIQEIAKEDKEKQNRHLRRVVAKQERLKACPPRLGKHKFQPAPVQVLLSEEISGSLRKLKGCCTLARDRFKSLEKRGLVVPTAKSGRSCVLEQEIDSVICFRADEGTLTSYFQQRGSIISTEWQQIIQKEWAWFIY